MGEIQGCLHIRKKTSKWKKSQEKAKKIQTTKKKANEKKISILKDDRFVIEETIGCYEKRILRIRSPKLKIET